jgi:cytochrome c oxidase subunit 3
VEHQFDAAKLGMWLFLATEILLFGGLFCAYAVYRGMHPEIFVWAHVFLDTALGATNTVILLCSSLTMAWAVRAAQLGQRGLLLLMLALTLAGGSGFLVIKYVEYRSKFEHGLLWAQRFDPHVAGAHGTDDGTGGTEHDPAAVAGVPRGVAAEAFTVERSAVPRGAEGPTGTVFPLPATEHAATAPAPEGAQVFFSIYFLMTGLHGLHVVLGMLAIGWVLVRAARGEFAPDYYTPVDFVGLYWHLVDLIWMHMGEHATHHEGSDQGPPAHAVPLRLLFTVLGALLALTLVTVAVTWVDLGALNLVVALAIAVVKGSLVLLYFMHLRQDSPFHALVVIAALVLVVIFVGLSLLDGLAYEPTLIPDFGAAPEAAPDAAPEAVPETAPVAAPGP